MDTDDRSVFAVVDAGIACLAVSRPSDVFFPVLAFLIEQIVATAARRGGWGARPERSCRSFP